MYADFNYVLKLLIQFIIYQVEVPLEYHSKIIGKKGAVISKLRDEYQVNITMPKPEDPNPQLITIRGIQDIIFSTGLSILLIVSPFAMVLNAV